MDLGGGDLTTGNIYGLGVITQGDVSVTTLQTSQAQSVGNINSANAASGTTTFVSGTANITGNLASGGSISTEGGAKVKGNVIGSETVRIQNLTCVNPGDCP